MCWEIEDPVFSHVTRLKGLESMQNIFTDNGIEQLSDVSYAEGVDEEWEAWRVKWAPYFLQHYNQVRHGLLNSNLDVGFSACCLTACGLKTSLLSFSNFKMISSSAANRRPLLSILHD